MTILNLKLQPEFDFSYVLLTLSMTLMPNYIYSGLSNVGDVERK